jgi:O-methyltransferase domain
VPDACDAYVLKSIIHDWEDEESIAILRSCRQAMGAESAVLVIERDLGPPNENPAAKLSDLNMFVMPGGRERSEDEYAALFEGAGLRHSSTTLAANAVFEAVAA